MVDSIKNMKYLQNLSKNIIDKIDIILSNYYSCITSTFMEYEKKYSIRFKDYYDISSDSETNINFFRQYCPNVTDNDVFEFCKFFLEKELEEFFYVLDNPEDGIEELFELFDETRIFDDAIFTIEYMKELLSQNVINNSNNSSSLINLVIAPKSMDEIISISENNNGNGAISLSRSYSALKILSNVSYNNPDISRKIHKVLDNSRDHDIKLTDHRILLERYSTSKTTKIVFLKIPIAQENVEIIKQQFNMSDFENMYYIVGFGDFSYSGYSEGDFYKMFIKIAYRSENEIQKIVDLFSKPLIRVENGIEINKVNEAIKLVDNSFDNIENLSRKSQKKK